MNAIEDIVERIRRLPEAYVDRSFGQGRDAFLRQLEQRTGRDEVASVDLYIEGSRNTITGLVQKIAPYHIPDDYIFFLEYYGGLFIKGDHYSLSVLGTGPMVEEWYSSVNSDDALHEVRQYGFLTLGSLGFGEHPNYRFQEVTFFLDVAGNVQKHCVIGVGPWGQETPTPVDILKDIHAHPDQWRKATDSFTEWLEQAAETNGAFGYS
jgi:hypothetical protein